MGKHIKKTIFLFAVLVNILLLQSAAGEEVHDIAVTDMYVWPNTTLVQGDYIGISYEITNEGTLPEYVTVKCNDSTDDITFFVEVLYLLPNETLYINCTWWKTTGASLGNHIIKVSAEPVLGEIDTDDNLRSTIVHVEEQIHDVAVNSIDAPLIAYQYDVIPVYVNVGNEGNVDEYSIQIVLKDKTDGVTIDTKTVDLYKYYPNQNVSFSWNTCGASVGNHVLEAMAILNEGEIDRDIDDNTKTATMTIKQPLIMSSLNTDEHQYKKGSTVKITAIVENLGNQVLNATLHFTYIRPDQSIAYIEDTTVSVQVGNSANAESNYELQRKGFPEGTWTVKAELIYEGQNLDTKTTTFEVVKKL